MPVRSQAARVPIAQNGEDGRIYVAEQIYSNTSARVFYDRILVSSPIPKASSYALLSVGLVLLSLARRRRSA